MEQPRQRQDFARRIARSFLRDGEPFAIRNARKVDARGVRDHAWVVSDGESLVAVGTSDDDCETACRNLNIPDTAVMDASGAIMIQGMWISTPMAHGVHRLTMVRKESNSRVRATCRTAPRGRCSA